MCDLTVFGMQPEAIELLPIERALSVASKAEHVPGVTGQYRQMLDPVLEMVGLWPDHDLAIMKPGQDLTHVTSAVRNRGRYSRPLVRSGSR